MERYTLKTVLGSFDYETITVKGVDYIATISHSNGNRYLKITEVPKPVTKFLKACGYKIALYDATQLNQILGLRK
jgi:hypothetical protein